MQPIYDWLSLCFFCSSSHPVSAESIINDLRSLAVTGSLHLVPRGYWERIRQSSRSWCSSRFTVGERRGGYTAKSHTHSSMLQSINRECRGMCASWHNRFANHCVKPLDTAHGSTMCIMWTAPSEACTRGAVDLRHLMGLILFINLNWRLIVLVCWFEHESKKNCFLSSFVVDKLKLDPPCGSAFDQHTTGLLPIEDPG